MTYTDRFDQELHIGDRVVALYSGSLMETEILELIPLVPHRDQPAHLMRADQARKKDPTRFGPSNTREPEKEYVLMGQRSVWKYNLGQQGMQRQAFNVPNDIIKVPSDA